MPEPLQLVLAALAAAAGAVVQGAVGFGFALVAAPLWALIDPRLVPGPATVASVGFGLLNVRRTRGGYADWSGTRWAGVGLVPGTAAAGALLAVLTPRLVAAGVGVLVLVAVLVSIWGIEFRRTPGAMLAVGAVSGFMGTAATVGGPPIALAYQHEPGPVIRATLARFFLFAALLAIPALVAAGRLGPGELLAGLALLPGVAVGFVLSRRLHGPLDRGWARPAVLTIAALSAAGVLLRELL